LGDLTIPRINTTKLPKSDDFPKCLKELIDNLLANDLEEGKKGAA
jgi:hypothetical protein